MEVLTFGRGRIAFACHAGRIRSELWSFVSRGLEDDGPARGEPYVLSDFQTGGALELWFTVVLFGRLCKLCAEVSGLDFDATLAECDGPGGDASGAVDLGLGKSFPSFGKERDRLFKPREILFTSSSISDKSKDFSDSEAEDDRLWCLLDELSEVIKS